jgi:hypothetical protein
MTAAAALTEASTLEPVSLKPEEAAILALLRGRLVKEAELSTSPTSRAKRLRKESGEAVDGSR